METLDCTVVTAMREITPEYETASWCDPYFEVSYRMRYLRSKLGISDKKLRKKLGWSKKKLSKFEYALNDDRGVIALQDYINALGFKFQMFVTFPEETHQLM